MHFVFVRAEHPGGNVIGDDEIAALAREFFPRVAQQIARFGREAHDQRRASRLARRDARENIGIFDKGQRRRAAVRVVS